MREIQLTRGKVAIVDDEDYERLSEYKWQAQKATQKAASWYARRGEYLGGGRKHGRKKLILMHREILGLGDDDGDVDHLDGNGLNNVRSNIRMASRSANMQRGHRAVGKSGFIGVRRTRNNRNPWIAVASLDGKKMSVGSYATPKQAAWAYDEAVLRVYGPHARVNFQTRTEVF